ncbi:DUF4148 domain-containing protein [Piscinibacter terrae]|uniref:DUF4148 domain-containing protein n=1 Tax=Piscinibacter terrae TaxID=2496871 RepID=A0A3N7HIC3_9BURK|nr:DUF4148 domain-containing protein [Albitalea terrae]RQP21790.1 DUF4148 domain-containing protein [Albitalea terrae]
MSNRIPLLSIICAATGLASPLVFADQDGFRTLRNDAGAEFVGQSSTLTREQVKAELEAARRDGSLRLIQRSASLPDNAPRAGFVSSRDETRQAMRLREQPATTGWRYVGGEAGWVYEGR